MLQGGYADWIHGWDLNGTDLDNDSNPDSDSANNLYEYALGGDPTNGFDIGYLPILGNFDADYESVTNRIDTAGKTNEFIRLRIDAL